jgi:hypothetical protein
MHNGKSGTGVASGTGMAFPSGAHEFTLGLSGAPVAQTLVYNTIQ